MCFLNPNAFISHLLVTQSKLDPRSKLPTTKSGPALNIGMFSGWRCAQCCEKWHENELKRLHSFIIVIAVII